MISTNVAELKDVWVRFRNEYALQGINLEIPSQDYMAILGPNGAGKSTLLKVILGVVKPEKGEVRVFGEDPFKNRKVVVENIGYVPQKENVNDKVPLRAIDVVLMGISTKKFLFNRNKAMEKALKALEYVNLRDVAYKLFRELSGGQKQRVLIARAIVSDPKLLLLDEPFSALDAYSSRVVASLLRKLNQEGKTIVVVTHDLAPILDSIKRVALLNKKLIAVGKPKEVLTTENLMKAYGIHVKVISYDGICYPLLGDQHEH
ncbi:ABC transporter ATP-binding protein [Ignicoccus pacificus DSM 13166]|uniref:ABC transporter ATP-binding protein n=1 Tax=Ignicoccus pacificus DSM 13166 TaxID=940294 RepID=A0A977PJ82_9CREN|nr:ABC transporter ATP-binding protein [Ignicoccus pacificus DSM 13166]